LFYNPEKDKRLPEAFIEGGRPSIKKYEKVIEIIKSDLLGINQLTTAANLKQNQIRVILTDLIEQGIVREAIYGKRKKYEFIPNSQPLDIKPFDDLRKAKLEDLEKMLGYVETTDSRMKYLCDYLGDASEHNFTNCDNTGEKKVKVIVTPEWTEKLQAFRENTFPKLKVSAKTSNLIDGVAASYYGVSNVGAAIHRAEKIARTLEIPISHNLVKSRETKEQKIFENTYLKKDNVINAFSYMPPNEISGKNIILIDDIFDSGATIKEIGTLLTNMGAIKIAPLVIARTVGGDLV
jgi:ATP-dependent DNA helicase RecQ